MKNIQTLQRQGMLTDQQILQAYRFVRNPSGFTLAPTQFRILKDLLVDEIPLEVYEKQRNWAARSAKVVLGVLLFSLQEIQGTVEPRALNDNNPEDHDPVTAEEEVEYLKADDFADILPLVREYGFTPREARLFLILKRAPNMQAGKEAILTRLYADQVDDAPQLKIIDVFICKMRKKLEGTVWEIETIWGAGYKLVHVPLPPPSAVDKLKSADTFERDMTWYIRHVYESVPIQTLAADAKVAPSTVMRAIHKITDTMDDEELDNIARSVSAGHSEDNKRLTT